MLVPALSFEVGRVFSMASFMTHRQFRSSLFFKEWVSPRGYIDTVGTLLEKSPTSISVLSAVRLKNQGIVDKKHFIEWAGRSPYPARDGNRQGSRTVVI